MLQNFDRELNDLLVDTFRIILKVEAAALQGTGQVNLSISEMHLLEAVGKGGENGRTISDIAQDLQITLPSVTIAINKLVRKGYVEKVKSNRDARIVLVMLTPLGCKTDGIHQYFHEQMVQNISLELSETEKQTLTQGMIKLNSFFRRKSREMELE